MHMLLKLGAGIVARFIGLLAERFAQWLFNEVSEGSESVGESLSELRQFGEWFLKSLAGQLCGRSRHHFDGYDDDYQPGYFGNR